MALKMSKKPRSIGVLAWFDFRQSQNRKTVEKLLKEPTKGGLEQKKRASISAPLKSV